MINPEVVSYEYIRLISLCPILNGIGYRGVVTGMTQAVEINFTLILIINISPDEH